MFALRMNGYLNIPFRRLNTNLPPCFQSILFTSPTTSSVSVDVFTAPKPVSSSQRRPERLHHRTCRSHLTRQRRRGESPRPVASVTSMAGVQGTVWQPRGRRRRQPAAGRLRHFRLHFFEVSHLINLKCVADPVRLDSGIRESRYSSRGTGGLPGCRMTG